MQALAYSNTLLSRLMPDTVERLHLSRVELEVGHEIEFPGSPIENLFFVEEGMASMTNTFSDGSQVEVGMFGFESAIGISALMGTRRSLNRVYTQVEGWGYRSPVEAARKEFDAGGLFQKLALRYVQAQLVQTAQSAGCNAKHHVEQRLARWLLITADRVHRTSFKMSQEFLADMVGVTRSTVSLAAGALKDEGLVDYSRGQMAILDVAGLERRSCECYRVIKDHLDNYAEFDDRESK
jgi:CRP-like cAMP-binding protein